MSDDLHQDLAARNHREFVAAVVANPDRRREAAEGLDQFRRRLPESVRDLQLVVAGEMVAVSDRDLGEAVRRLEPLSRVLVWLVDLETELDCDAGFALSVASHVLSDQEGGER